MEKIKILLDTDMGRDCDDVGALAVLHNIADETDTEILAVTHCASEISGAVAVKYINEWYGRHDIAVGRYCKRKFLEDDICRKYTKPLMECYLKNHTMPKFESATKVMRRSLSGNEDVTIVVIGMMNNIAELLESEPDEISPLNGVELVNKHVKSMYVMGGNFFDKTFAEYNIATDVKSAQYVSENFPKPIVYCGFEIGTNIYTGKNVLNATDINPVSLAYHIHCGYNATEYKSWDLVTIYCAIFKDTELFKISENFKIGFDDIGRTFFCKGGKDFYLMTAASNEKISEAIDKYLK